MKKLYFPSLITSHLNLTKSGSWYLSFSPTCHHPVGQLSPAFHLSKTENEKRKCVLSPFINNQEHTTQVTLSERVSPPLVHASAVPNNSPLTAHSSQDGTCTLHSSSVPLPAQRLIKQKATEIKRLVFISIHMGH